MEENKVVHLIFCIDSSGSMYGNESDVLGGFKKTIDEQRSIKDGKCIVSLFTFDSDVKKHFIGKDVNEVEELEYKPHGMTALYDAIGISINEIGDWYNNKPESERMGKKIVIIITDGQENSSQKFGKKKIKEMIDHQQSKYGWEFLFLGNDLTNSSDVDDFNMTYKAYTTKTKFYNNYNIISTATTAYRCAATLDEANTTWNNFMVNSVLELNDEYEKDTGLKINNGSLNG